MYFEAMLTEEMAELRFFEYQEEGKRVHLTKIVVVYGIIGHCYSQLDVLPDS